MKLIVGLGNPGPKYAQNRHNLGFLVLDRLAEQLNATPWHLEKKFKAEIAEVELEGGRIILAKPQTYMNNSGEAVKPLVHFYKDELSPDSVWVIHDDIDLNVGELRIKQGGSSGGQNGVQSIIDHLGPDFHRARIGIGQNDRPSQPAEVYVLKDMPKTELQHILDDTALFDELRRAILA